MIALLLILTWLTQGIPVPAAQTGTVTGTLKTDLGAPAVGVRVGAMVRPESAAEINAASALSSIAETDAAGHFRLENVPQGRYYITAGRVDYPTYFPGTQDITSGRVVLVKPGDVISDIDFALNSVAVRPPDYLNLGTLGIVGSPSFIIPVSTKVDGGGPLPVFSAAGLATLRLSRIADAQVTEMPLSTMSLVMAIPTGLATPDYRVTVENVPTGYTVGSLKYGAGELTNNILKLSTSNTAMAGNVISTSGGITPGQVFSITASSFSIPPTGSSGLTITLLPNSPTAQATGVRVSGRAPNAEVRSVYLSGVPGTFFADGSFEFRGVQPGRYTVSTPDNPSSSKPLAAAIAVGNQDVTGIELTATPMLPLNIKTPVPPESMGSHTPGSTIPLAVLRGVVLDETTNEPITTGSVYLTGHYGGSVSLAPEGKFEFVKLLPGSYELEVQAFGHSTVKKTIVVGEADVNLEFSTMPLP